MSFSDNHVDYSQEGLEEYARELINKNLEEEESSRTSVCLAIAGGGGYAIATLAATPGASSMLLEGTVLYDRKSFRSYVGLPSHTTDFRYSSLNAAKLASEAALKRALDYRSSNLRLMNGCVGIGCASALVSSSSPDSVKGYGYIVATRSDGCRLALNVTLASKKDIQSRGRKEEDIFIGHLVLRAIELIRHAQNEQQIIRETETDAGDAITEKWELTPALSRLDEENEKDVPMVAAELLLSGDSLAAVLLPMYKEGRPVSFRLLEFPIVPRGSFIFPGSFNPPHVGHIALAEAAIKTAMSKLDRFTHVPEPPVLMEISLTNADKPPIDPSDVSQRLNKFLELPDLPEQWGVLLTRAPLFAEKVSVFHDCILDKAEGFFPKMSFVIGTDTMVRILNPKYYGNDESAMYEAIRSMNSVHFVVGGRLEQNKSSSGPPRFISGAEELVDLPADIQGMFTIIKEEDFRVDVSSSEIRQHGSA